MKNIEFLEQNGVDIKNSLQFFGDVNAYNETISDYLVNIHTKITQLISFYQNNDLANYSIYVHSMKSDSKYYGFNKLSNICYEHELRSKAGDMNYINEHINDLIDEVNNVINILKEYIEGTSEQKQEEPNSFSAEVYTTKTILVVDDSNIVRNFVKRIFSDTYNVGDASNGEEAIRIIDANKDNDNIVAILLDLNMPKVDGFQVLEFMKNCNLLKKMPVSIISGDSSKETIDKAFKYEIVDMLSKPFTDQNVKMVIEKTLIYRGEK